MPEEEDFFIEYRSEQLRITPVINKGNIYFIVHFNPPIIIAEGMIEEEWVWYEAGKGETDLSQELGTILEKLEL